MSAIREPPASVASLFASLSLSPDAVFVTDRRNRVVFWNRTAERILGYTREEAAGVSCDEFLRGCDVFGNRYCSPGCPVMQMAARAEPVRHFELRIKAKDGALVAVDLTILSLMVEPPEHYYIAHIFRPIDRIEAVHAEPAPAPTLAAVRESPDARVRKLTAREVEVLAMMAAGHATPEIASRLTISTLTARNHIQNILEKLEVHSKSEAIAFAFQKHLI